APENLEALRKRFSSLDMFAVSAAKGEGIEALKRHLSEFLQTEGR
ncbi:MAG: hypothetical protein JWO45_1243, partial [Spartobacteria bacterium]|nr:hypothetical protein [Spartobacteria bacterium]